MNCTDAGNDNANEFGSTTDGLDNETSKSRKKTLNLFSTKQVEYNITPTRKRPVEIFRIQAARETDVTLSPSSTASRSQVIPPESEVQQLASPPRNEKVNSPPIPWTPKDLRLIFPSSGGKTPTCISSVPGRKKKKVPRSNKVQRDSLKQLRLFEMKKVNALKDSVEAVASE